MAALELPSPTLDHLHYSDYERVYEPAEDSSLLMDALSKVPRCFLLFKMPPPYPPTPRHSPSDMDEKWQEHEDIKALMPGLTLEIGSGSGIVTAHLSAILRHGGVKALHWVTDINPDALATTLRTGEANEVPHLDV